MLMKLTPEIIQLLCLFCHYIKSDKKYGSKFWKKCHVTLWLTPSLPGVVVVDVAVVHVVVIHVFVVNVIVVVIRLILFNQVENKSCDCET